MRELLVVMALILAPAVLTAQTPSPELLRRPENAARIRSAIGTSGLSPAQIRARLRALGYSETILDQFLENRPDSLAGPNPQALEAIRALGLSGSDDPIVPDVVPGRPGDLRTDLPAERQPGLRIFGRDVFDRVTSQFQPALSGPVDETYRLGAGDVLVLILTGDVELTHQLEVTREGFILIPQVGQIFVSGLTLGQLDRVLATRLGRVYSGINRGPNASTKFQITVAKLRTNQIFVIGEVVRPGSYQVSSAGTVLTALYLAGGPGNNGSFRRVLVRRGQRVVDSLDLYDYLLRGDTRHDVRLETGDVVFVPVRSVPVEIGGAVVRPAIYELHAGETLRDLLEAAGGFEPTALRRRIQIDRVLPPEERAAGGRDRVVLDITEDQLRLDAPPPFPLAAADRVKVFSVSERRRNVVTVRGNVWVAGQVGFKPGMRLSDAIRLTGGAKPDVYLGQILISRLNPDSTRNQLRSSFRDSTGTLTDDLGLAEDDDIQVFSRTEFRPTRFVAITGAVRKPGRIPFHEGMTLRDAILETGGVTEDALLSDAELARLPTDRSQGAMAVTSRVALDSTYLFDRSPSGAYNGPPGLPAARSGAPEIKLEPYDNVLILRQPDWELARTVHVGGQVRYPGRYVLRSKTERLVDLIARAGGLTKEAYAEGAELYRQLPPEQAAPIKIGSRLVAADSTRAPALDPLLSQRVGLDLARAMAEPGRRENLIIQTGDSLYVPEYRATVRVLGAVNAPTSIIYRQGWNLYDYVGAAGGVARQGDKGRSYVVQPGGRLESVKSRGLFTDSKPKPLPGAVVFVPERDPNDKKDWTGLFASIAQILASTVAIIVVAARL